jgi:hypothetical protein
MRAQRQAWKGGDAGAGAHKTLHRNHAVGDELTLRGPGTPSHGQEPAITPPRSPQRRSRSDRADELLSTYTFLTGVFTWEAGVGYFWYRTSYDG